MNIQLAIAEAHGVFQYDRYFTETHIKDNTNCYAYALGLLSASNRELYRIGAISGKKAIDKCYFSEEEMKTLLLEDLKTLQLEVKSIELNEVSKISIANNQYVIFLFGTYYANEIKEFHFWRLDSERGITQKRFGQLPVQVEFPKRDWPAKDWKTKFLGAYVITKK